jgi:hypothetical protein
MNVTSNAWSPQNTMNRPIVGLSAYVVERMPEAFATKSINMLEVDALKHKSRDHSANPLAALDCKMLEITLIHSGLSVPVWLSRLVDSLSINRPCGILYEEIIEANPEQDMRCFSTGVVRETERDFYLAHKQIEEVLRLILIQLQADIVQTAPNNLKADLKKIIDLTASLAHMPPGHFNLFRPHLESHPIRDTRGPSGLFSAGMAELQLRSGFQPEGFIDFLLNNMVYFPARAVPQILMTLYELEKNTARLKKNPEVAEELRNFWQKMEEGTLVFHQAPGT